MTSTKTPDSSRLTPDSLIYVAGHTGLVGSALIRKLQNDGYSNLLTCDHGDLDLINQSEVNTFFSEQQPEFVYLAAARVGGIHANSTYPAEFIYENIAIQTNIIHAAWKNNVKKLLFLGSSCIYPKYAPQPMKEDCLLTDTLEPTNQWYAIAKIAGLKQCQAYRMQYGFNAISVMPTNLYGLGDNFDPDDSHVLPALIHKIHEAKTKNNDFVNIWGSGEPKREFLHVDDLADACLFLMKNYDEGEPINVGAGKEISIIELANLIKSIVNFDGRLEFDLDKPDGTPRKLLDSSKIQQMSWSPRITLENGIKNTYAWYLENISTSETRDE